MVIAIGLLLLGLVLLYFGAEFLVRGSANLALHMGVSALVVGLTIVAFGTSAPELVVSLKAGLDGNGDIAIGNVVGSNIFNIAMILGISALIQPMKVNLNVLRVDTPIMVAVSVLFFICLRDFTVSRIEGVILTLGIIIYTIVTIIISRTRNDKIIDIPVSQVVSPKKNNVLISVCYIILGLGSLVVGSRFFVDGAVDLARFIGVSEAVIGLTIVAGGTSLPELATSIIAAVKKESDIAIGNIIGSNIFNILAIIGISSCVSPLHAAGINPINLYFMMGVSVMLFPLMRTGFKLSRIEGGIMLSVYGCYLLYILH
ncbi:MAG: calcium/sodium antiporter [Fibrobacter sp.]|nr:calcium/sodium antiporter [Fibrobacter sp.]